MSRINEKMLAEKAISSKLLTPEQLNECFRAIDESPESRSLTDVLLEKKFLTEEQLRSIVQDPRGKTSATMMSVGSPAPSQAPPPFPHDSATTKRWIFGRYHIVSELGRGGMGVVYRAKDPQLQREIAIKMLLHEEEGSQEAVQRFEREARAAANLNHPNIVHIHDIGVVDGRHYFTMDFVDGSSLDEMLDDVRLPTAATMRPAATIPDSGPVPEPLPERPTRQVAKTRKREVVDKGIRILVQIARALHQAHAQGIIHRDLKPENILLTADGSPKLTDFGLAKEYRKNEDGRKKMTVTGTVMGTPWYMSPEQAAGEIDRLGPASDIFSLGVILYELITGTRPFNEDTVPATLHAVMEKDPVPPRRVQPALHKDLQTVCLKSLAKEPYRRYHTAVAFAEDLERYLAGEPIAARPTSLTYLVWKRVQKHRYVASVVFAGVLALVLGGGAALWGWSRYRDASTETADQRRARLLLEEKQARRLKAEELCAEGKQKLDLVADPLAKRDFQEADRHLEEGLALLAKSIEVDRGYPEALLARARAQRLAGKPEPALRDVQEALALVPSHPEALYLRAVLRVERYSGGILGDPSDAAIVEESTAKEEKAKALADLELLAKSEFRGLPGWAASHARGAKALLEGKPALAVEELGKVVAENAALWDVHFQTGLAHERLQEWEAARKCYSECLRRNPRHAPAWINRGRLMTSSEPEQAVRDFTEGINLDRTNSRAWYCRGHVYFHMGKMKESLDDNDEAIGIDPTFAAAYNGRGLTLERLGKTDEAILDFGRAIQSEPNVAAYHRNRAALHLGKCHHEEAFADYEKVVSLEPRAASSYYLRGIYWTHMKDLEKSLKDYTEALTLNPGLAEAHVNKANIYLQQGKFDDAIAECSAAIGTHPISRDAHGKAYVNRGIGWLNKKEYSKAKADFEAALKVDPSPEMGDTVHGWLDKIEREYK